MSKVFDPGKGARREARRARAEQEKQIAKQRQIEQGKIAEEEDVIARRKALAKPGAGGRSLLIATSPTGTSTTLGGTS